MSILFECKNLSKAYGGSNSVYALNDVNLQIESGKIIGLLGPNGSGKSTLIKLANGLLTPTSGEIYIDGNPVGEKTKSIISYLPERSYLNINQRVKDLIDFFQDFYIDFRPERALDMLANLNINPSTKLKVMSKGTREKVQLILVMSRAAKLYLLDEPIGGVDPAARDYILNTIITNYDSQASIIISTHLIQDIEQVLDEAVFIQYGNMVLHKTVDEIRDEEGKSVDGLFREVFKC